MNGIIVYKSKYGATKKYVEWLAEETGFDTVETAHAKINTVQKYDVIILGGGIYAGGIAGISFLKKNIKALQDKKVMIFCTGACPLDDKVLEQIKKNNMKAQLEHIPYFYCRGIWDIKGMSLIDRSLCKMLIKSIAKKNPNELDEWEKGLLAMTEERQDWTDKKYLNPILKAINA